MERSISAFFMKVNEFSKRIGIPSSKIRYYDRLGITKGERIDDNNYRDFDEKDALMLYHAQMLRSFGMTLDETLSAQNQPLDQINGWLDQYMGDLEKKINFEKMRLLRLQEMKAYFQMMQTQKITFTQVDQNQNVYTFGHGVSFSLNDLKMAQLLSQHFPFTYVVIKIDKESLYDKAPGLKVSIGLGMLKRNIDKLCLDLKGLEIRPKAKVMQFLYECEDPFALTKKDLENLYDELEKRQMILDDDLVGRIYFSYVKDDRLVYGLGLSVNLDQ